MGGALGFCELKTIGWSAGYTFPALTGIGFGYSAPIGAIMKLLFIGGPWGPNKISLQSTNLTETPQERGILHLVKIKIFYSC